ncbi:hypothetical protein BH11PAT1_BH11PAT1_6070 [soil metagenome]
MPEQGPSTGWDNIRHKITGVKFRTRHFFDDLVQDTKYRFMVPGKENENASRNAELFAGELLNFLKLTPASSLESLYPSIEQKSVFNNLIKSVELGKLFPTGKQGRIDDKKRPFVSLGYMTDAFLDINPENLLDYYTSTDSSLSVAWGVREPYPHGFLIVGRDKLTLVDPIQFITLPQKPSSANEVDAILQITKSTGSGSVAVNLVDGGKRFTIVKETAQQPHITQYSLIGAFDGSDTNRSYWVYGRNIKIGNNLQSGAKQSPQISPHLSTN